MSEQRCVNYEEKVVMLENKCSGREKQVMTGNQPPLFAVLYYSQISGPHVKLDLKIGC